MRMSASPVPKSPLLKTKRNVINIHETKSLLKKNNNNAPGIPQITSDAFWLR